MYHPRMRRRLAYVHYVLSERKREREGRLASEMIAEFSRPECSGEGEGAQERSPFRDRRTSDK